jgi:hypothetical protein
MQGRVITFWLWAVAYLLAEILSALLFHHYIGWGWLP